MEKRIFNSTGITAKNIEIESIQMLELNHSNGLSSFCMKRDTLYRITYDTLIFYTYDSTLVSVLINRIISSRYYHSFGNTRNENIIISQDTILSVREDTVYYKYVSKQENSGAEPIQPADIIVIPADSSAMSGQFPKQDVLQHDVNSKSYYTDYKSGKIEQLSSKGEDNKSTVKYLALSGHFGLSQVTENSLLESKNLKSGFEKTCETQTYVHKVSLGMYTNQLYIGAGFGHNLTRFESSYVTYQKFVDSTNVLSVIEEPCWIRTYVTSYFTYIPGQDTVWTDVFDSTLATQSIYQYGYDSLASNENISGSWSYIRIPISVGYSFKFLKRVHLLTKAELTYNYRIGSLSGNKSYDNYEPVLTRQFFTAGLGFECGYFVFKNVCVYGFGSLDNIWLTGDNISPKPVSMEFNYGVGCLVKIADLTKKIK